MKPDADLREWFDGFVGSEEERAVADALLALLDASCEWVRVYDANSKSNIEWSNGMQRLRMAIHGVDRAASTRLRSL